MKYTYSTPLSSSITQSGALPRLTVKHPACSAELFLHGAHLTRWQPAGQEPVLFVSSDAVYAPGMPIRGGVPICFPWFGPHVTDKSLPAHGFARTRAWELAGFGETSDHAWFHLQFSSSAQTRDLWGYDFQADFRLTLGRELDLKLSISNTGATPLTFEEALHTYYHVSDIRAVGVSGLEGVEYQDRTAGLKRKTEPHEVIRFEGEMDRTYQNTAATCVIEDPGLKRRIIVEKNHSQATVVWNPGETRAATFKDLGVGNWPSFVCVETANCVETAVTLAPGRTHEMTARISVAAL